MKDSFNIYAQDKLVRIAITIGGLSIVLLSALVLFFQLKLPPVVPFLNSMPWGAQRLVPSQFVLLGVPIIVLFFLLNTFLGVVVYKKHALAARILSINAALFIFLGLVAYIQILLLVF